jgi:hypothetical protein
MSHRFQFADGFDQTAREQRMHDAIAIHAAQRFDLRTRYRLTIRDDRERFERGGRQARRGVQAKIFLHLLGHFGRADKLHAFAHFLQPNAARRVFAFQFRDHKINRRHVLRQCLRERFKRDRSVGNQNERFD